MPSKQFEHLQAQSLRRLQARIPSGCPLLVSRLPAGGFEARTWDATPDAQAGRFQVVAAWIDGYVAAWGRLARTTRAIGHEWPPSTPTPRGDEPQC